MGDQSRKIGGTAGTILATAVGVYLQGTIHPRLALCLYAIALISCLFAAVQWPWVQRFLGIHHEPLLSPPLPPAAPTATASMGAVTFSPVFNNQTGDRFAVNGELLDGTKLVPSAAPSVERPKPNLISHGIHKAAQTEHNFVFDTKNGDVIYALRVQNSVRGAIIQGAIASIRFNGKDGMLAMVDRAYWYGESPHEVEFQLNATRSIVLGRCANGRWYYFNNSMRHLPPFGRDHFTEPDPPESFALDDSCTMIVEVFNPYRGGDIYLEKSFVISRTATDCTILED
jgi:hypothetical protein